MRCYTTVVAEATSWCGVAEHGEAVCQCLVLAMIYYMYSLRYHYVLEIEVKRHERTCANNIHLIGIQYVHTT